MVMNTHKYTSAKTPGSDAGQTEAVQSRGFPPAIGVNATNIQLTEAQLESEREIKDENETKEMRKQPTDESQ